MTNKLEKLRSAQDIHSLAPLLGFKPSSISYILFKISDQKRYRKFTIPKKSGGVRSISAPNDELLLLQRKLLQLLNFCLTIIERERPIKHNRRIAHGARKNYSIYTNAFRHKGKKYVCNLDLKDFFPSINFGRVRGYFIKNNHFLLHPKVATLIAQIACHENNLPQGSPTSSLIADLIAGSLDQRIFNLTQKFDCSYTRYIDDLTISTNKASLPKCIAFSLDEKLAKWHVGKELRSAIERSGFEINESKFRVQLYFNRQSVTGLVVNKKPNINRDYIRHVRSMVNNYCKTSTLFSHGNEAKRDGDISIQPKHLRGMLNHIFWVKGREFKYRRFTEKEKDIEPSFVKVYRRFLDYYSFFDTQNPVLLFEGKTDSIYVKCALKKIGQNFPSLFDSGKKEGYRVSFFKYTKHSLPVQRLGGGCGDIKLLLANFSRRTEKFSEEKRLGPLIVVVDNDQAARPLFSAIKEMTKSAAKVDGMEDFYDLGNRLFLVVVPKGRNKGDFPIEYLFTKTVLETKINNKALSLEDNFDEDKYYGKYVFAEKIVRPNEDVIDFSGFLPLLQRISAAIEFDKKSGA